MTTRGSGSAQGWHVRHGRVYIYGEGTPAPGGRVEHRFWQQGGGCWTLHGAHDNLDNVCPKVPARTAFKPYPYRQDDGPNDLAQDVTKVARGGSWYDRPKRARSGYRLAYRPYQRVFNVGIRVVCPAR